MKDIKKLDLGDGLYELGRATYLTKKGSKYRLLNTPRNDLNKGYTAKGNINWKNLLGFNDILSLLVILMLLFSAVSYTREIAKCKDLWSHPYKVACLKACGYYNNDSTQNIIPILNITGGANESNLSVFTQTND